jgi:hypothetical protein
MGHLWFVVFLLPFFWSFCWSIHIFNLWQHYSTPIQCYIGLPITWKLSWDITDDIFWKAIFNAEFGRSSLYSLGTCKSFSQLQRKPTEAMTFFFQISLGVSLKLTKEFNEMYHVFNQCKIISWCKKNKNWEINKVEEVMCIFEPST